MNTSELKQIIREEILKEFMDIKQLAKKAEQEIDKYNFGRLFAQLSQNNKGNSEMRKLMEYRLNDCADAMPSLKLLMPDMFIISTGSTGAVDARLETNEDTILGIIPSTFYGGLVNQYVLDRDKMKEWVKNKVREKLKYQL